MSNEENSDPKPRIVDYVDYRKYVSDLFSVQKSKRSKFSLAFCARALKTSTPYLKHVMAGRRHISLDKINAISQLFALNQFETRYFVFLFLWQTTQDKNLKQYFWDTLGIFNAQNAISPTSYSRKRETLPVCQESWLHSTIHAMARLPEFQPDADWIQAHLVDNVSANEISVILTQLIESGDIIKGKSGGWEPVAKDHTPDPHDLSSFQVYKSALKKASDVIDRLPEYKKAFFYSGALPVDSSGFSKIGAPLHDFIEKLSSLSNEVEHPTNVMMFSLNLFNLTK